MHPIEIDAILKLAKTHLRSGKIPEAEQMYVRVLKEQPGSAEALHFLGLAAMQRGKLDKALELVRRSIEIDPSRADYHNNLATVLGRMNAAVEAQAGKEPDEFIAMHIHGKSSSVPLSASKRIGKALASSVPKRTAAQCKTDLLALLSNYFEQAATTGQAAGITAVELRALADAAAFDESDGRQPADHQLPAGQDALRKRLARARRQWKRQGATKK